MNAEEQIFLDRINSRMGTASLACGSLMAILIFADRTELQFLPLPAIWYQTRSFHIIICLLFFGFAAALLKSPVQPRKPEPPPGPVFRSVRVYTREECQLCDKAVEILNQYEQWLPQTELVSIDDHPGLRRQFGQSVPVVEFDGRIRFRGAVQPVLLQRLIDGRIAQHAASSRQSELAVRSDADHRATSGTEQPG